MEAEHFGQRTSGAGHNWLLKTSQSGYTGTAYLQSLPDLDRLYQTDEITASPAIAYPVNFTTPGTYTVWLRGYPANAAGDSVYVGLEGQVVTMTGFTPGQWTWTHQLASEPANEVTATLVVSSTGLYTVSLWAREDGLRLDRLLLTTDTTYLPAGFGPAETDRQAGTGGLLTVVNRTIAYDYDNLYRLTSANYSTGQAYDYSYDPVGNRLQQIIDGDTTTYLYDAANRLEQVGTQGYTQTYTFDANGNLLNTGVLTNVFDAANRLIETEREGYLLEPLYNGVGDRVGQTVGVTTTHFALDVQGLPEVIYTSEGNSYLHLPGVIRAESAEGEVRYLLSDGLGSIRQAVDETGAVVSYSEFDPYGYTGEWWEQDVGLLHLRARWYLPYLNQFISPDMIIPDYFDPQSLNRYSYALNNPVNHTDPSGHCIVQWSGEVRMGQAPYGTSGLCPHTETPGEEAAHDVTEVSNTLRDSWNPFVDPLTPEQWKISKREAQRFRLPVELVAGTVAVEIVFDTDIFDRAGDLALLILLQRHLMGDCVSTSLLDAWEENRKGPTGEIIGPGAGVGGVHTATAKEIENYYAENGLANYLSPPPDRYWRMMILSADEGNIRYIAAYLKQLADIRKDTSAAMPGPTSPVMTSHLTDLDDIDMQIIYGAYRSGIASYGTRLDYQRWSIPGDRGREIEEYLPFYRRKALRE